MGYLAVITPLALHLFLSESKNKILLKLQKSLCGITLVAIIEVGASSLSVGGRKFFKINVTFLCL